MWRDLLEHVPPSVLPAIVGGLAVVIALRLMAGLLDVWRIRNYISAAGGAVQSCRWWPFGPGWLGEKRDRIYYISFTDAAGALHRAYCKTSLLTGVYFTQDRVVGQSKSPARADAAHESLHEELGRLREENRWLRQQLAANSGDSAQS